MMSSEVHGSEGRIKFPEAKRLEEIPVKWSRHHGRVSHRTLFMPEDVYGENELNNEFFEFDAVFDEQRLQHYRC